jgi:hypothetical protein
MGLRFSAPVGHPRPVAQPEPQRGQRLDRRRGAWYTVGPRGRRVTLGLAGSGLYWTESVPPAAPVHHGHRLAFTLVVLIGVDLLLHALTAPG